MISVNEVAAKVPTVYISRLIYTNRMQSVVARSEIIIERCHMLQKGRW